MSDKNRLFSITATVAFAVGVLLLGVSFLIPVPYVGAADELILIKYVIRLTSLLNIFIAIAAFIISLILKNKKFNTKAVAAIVALILLLNIGLITYSSVSFYNQYLISVEYSKPDIEEKYSDYLFFKSKEYYNQSENVWDNSYFVNEYHSAELSYLHLQNDASLHKKSLFYDMEYCSSPIVNLRIPKLDFKKYEDGIYYSISQTDSYYHFENPKIVYVKSGSYVLKCMYAGSGFKDDQSKAVDYAVNIFKELKDN